LIVIPAQAGIQLLLVANGSLARYKKNWIPACAGMTR
jgi:hypothetical protein